MRENGNWRITLQRGDSVIVHPQKELGIVFEPANARGEVGVQLRGEKIFVGHKRLKLKTSASELYPPDYDFSIIFNSVESRKAQHQMEKKHVEGLIIPLESGWQ